jgi:alpha-D-ribose 1-methylphosphonate 5-triphosphate synthase subunit PhnG
VASPQLEDSMSLLLGCGYLLGKPRHQAPIWQVAIMDALPLETTRTSSYQVAFL